MIPILQNFDIVSDLVGNNTAERDYRRDCDVRETAVTWCPVCVKTAILTDKNPL